MLKPTVGGTLKVRGRHKNIRRFLFQEITTDNNDDFNAKYCLGLDCEEGLDKFTTDYSYGVDSISGILFFNSMPTAYVDGGYIECCLDDECYYVENQYTLAIDNFRIEEKVDVNALKALSKKYNVDFKILSFDSYSKINQDVEIIGGEVIKDEIIKFDDYTWECVCPNA